MLATEEPPARTRAKSDRPDEPRGPWEKVRPCPPPPIDDDHHDPVGWERLALLHEGLGVRAKLWLLEKLGSPAGIFGATDDRLHALELDDRHVASLRDPRLEREALDELGRAARLGAKVVALASPLYPELLAHVPQPPLSISFLGRPAWDFRADGRLDPDPGRKKTRIATVAIVGTRQARTKDVVLARSLARDLAEQGIVIVSGLARGVDRAAHEGALDAPGGRTIAVLGHGLASLYPASHRDLAARIRERGALVSEYPIDAPSLPWHFPHRNRIIAGLADATVVVAGDDRSGALGTAAHALEANREVLAVPGPLDEILSRAPNFLIKYASASLLEHPDDVLAAIRVMDPCEGADRRQKRPPLYRPRIEKRPRPAPLGGVAGRIEEWLRAAGAPRFFDQIVSEGRFDPQVAMSALGMLELRRRVVRSAAGAYVAAPD